MPKTKKQPEPRESKYGQIIKTVDDLIKNVRIRNEFLRLVQKDEIKRGYTFKTEVDDEFKDLVITLETLGLVKPDWQAYDAQEFMADWKIRFTFEGSKILDLFDKIDGKNSILRKKAIELISQHIGNLDTGLNLVRFLEECGVPPCLIDYPNTKWRMIETVLTYYASSDEAENKNILFKIIEEAAHPLMHKGNIEEAKKTKELFNNYLQSSRFYLRNGIMQEEIDENDEYTKELLQDANEGFFIQEQEELTFLRQPENKEKISTLRKAYQVFMNIVEVFCENPSKPSHELNDAYVKTKKMITDAVVNLHLYVSSVNGQQRIHSLTHYCIPFNNLFTAEKEYTPGLLEIDLSGKKLSWDYLRPMMNATYGDIDDLYRKIEGSDVLSKPDVQETLNEMSLLLTKTKEENKKVSESKKKAETPQTPVQRFEITSIPPLTIKPEKDKPQKLEKTNPLKNKRIEYDENKSLISIDGKSCHLPPAKNEDYLAKAMFNRLSGEFVDWSLIYEEMTGDTIKETLKNQKTVRDTMNRLNKRIQNIFKTKDELISWENKSLKRNF